MLKTDHTRASDALERGLHALHAAARSCPSTPAAPPPVHAFPVSFAAAAAAAAALPAPAPPPASEPKRPRLDAAPQQPGGGADAGGPAPMDAAPAPPPAPPPAPAPPPPPPPPSVAFALIDEVSPVSPAEAAGMQVGDALLSLDSVRVASGALADGAAAAMRALAPAVAAAEGRPVAVWVLRGGSRVALTLTPRRWEGRGLLGCHLRPLV